VSSLQLLDRPDTTAAGSASDDSASDSTLTDPAFKRTFRLWQTPESLFRSSMSTQPEDDQRIQSVRTDREKAPTPVQNLEALVALAYFNAGSESSAETTKTWSTRSLSQTSVDMSRGRSAYEMNQTVGDIVSRSLRASGSKGFRFRRSVNLTPDDTVALFTQPPDFSESGPQPDQVRGLVKYLGSISKGRPGERSISPSTALLAYNLWVYLWSATGFKLPVPDACPGPDGQLLYTWDQGEHHLELEVFPEGASEFFYSNRVTNELWECDYRVTQPLPAEALVKLDLFG
jgi:hypothetical protein